MLSQVILDLAIIGLMETKQFFGLALFGSMGNTFQLQFGLPAHKNVLFGCENT